MSQAGGDQLESHNKTCSGLTSRGIAVLVFSAVGAASVIHGAIMMPLVRAEARAVSPSREEFNLILKGQDEIKRRLETLERKQ